MSIQLIAVGDKMPAWITAGFINYQKRLVKPYQLTLTEIPLNKSHRPHAIKQALEKEASAMLAHIPKQAYCIALSLEGKQYTTEKLAQKMPTWLHQAHEIALLIGGPEGLHQRCLARADTQWSLSELTFPHPLVRIMVAEQLYRAMSIIQHHPYHK